MSLTGLLDAIFELKLNSIKMRLQPKRHTPVYGHNVSRAVIE